MNIVQCQQTFLVWYHSVSSLDIRSCTCLIFALVFDGGDERYIGEITMSEN